MKTIEYRVIYGGVLGPKGVDESSDEEVVRVQARDINAGFGKALKLALEPLGNGNRREILSIKFWSIP